MIFIGGESAWRKAATYTGQHKHRIKADKSIHALSGIRTHDPRVRASEDNSCLRRRGHCNRQTKNKCTLIVQYMLQVVL
jgi:hypothetical protein